ncbi:UDP-N-acetylmuramoyl-L-alanine--D-glutamate ligase [Deinococcus detaillensis]|uniref:UDP-N-acetylmuramoylalanine--D-glutamate ligase n=1 Tax=Deinococcus detaillensis TaxID=2592048 RepID=A0A553V4J6_9DEIO|nr:UDP-N-acetylmuramoyl-L-alanine--D-glutamate ligase [Deinococcus detaillensis]TSA87131.1 UDP-N-acetylmuramoyl-L-alanine--D-glutamate ligase [Deinococcus detaillensis]
MTPSPDPAPPHFSPHARPQTLVYGLGRSGRGVLRFLARTQQSADWFDARPSAEDFDLAAQFGFARADLTPADLTHPYTTVVAAPGVPIDHPDLETLRQRGAEIIGEAELAARAYPQVPMVGVTGTAGKGSTTVLIAQLLRVSGLNAREGGNIDPPLLDIMDGVDAAVVELSSFQLERVSSFAPRVAVITNLASDHLDRHKTVEAYHAAKLNITRAQRSGNCLIVPVGLSVTTQAQILHFDAAHLHFSDGSAVLDVSDLPEGVHPANAAAAILAAESLLKQLGRPVLPEVFKQALKTAQPVKGRFETVAHWNDLRFVNDSIATRTVAVQSALEQAKAPVAWLVGGRDKGADLEPLRRAAAGKVRRVIAFGEDGPKLAEALGLPFVVVPFTGQGAELTMQEAVRLAAETLDGGGTVLLAPIGTSFDLYRDYAERGAAFTKAAQTWIELRDARQTSEVEK